MTPSEPIGAHQVAAEELAVDAVDVHAHAAGGPERDPATAEGGRTPAPGLGEAAEAQPSGPRPIPVTVWRRVAADVSTAFDIVVPIDLASIFTGYGPLPAVVATDGETEVWGVEGQHRTVRLADGGQMDETVVQVSRPGLFRYRVVPTRGLLRIFIRAIDGRFVFAPSEAGGTVIRWTYVFRPRRGASPVVRTIAPLWRRYALRVMERIADSVRDQAPAPATRTR